MDRSYLVIASLMRSGGILDAPNKSVGKGEKVVGELHGCMPLHCPSVQTPDAPCTPPVILGLLGVDREVVRRHAVLPRDDAAEKI